jgi:hypothetical protein
MDDRKKKAVEEFTKALAKAQAISFVAIVKEGDAPAQYRTGGYKGEGPTIVDMGKSIGVACAELAQTIISAAAQKGQHVEWDQAIDAVFESVADGAEAARVAANIKVSHRTVQEKDDEQRDTKPGRPSGPRGF